MVSKRSVGAVLHEAIKQLNALPPEERLSIYGMLRTEGFRMHNGSDVFNPEISAEDLQILSDGTIGIAPPTVFLSHSSSDKPVVRKIAATFRKSGLKVWLDEAELKFGDSLIGRLREALDEVHVVVAFLSRASCQSSWVQQELEVACTREIATRRVKVIPVLLEPVALPGFLVGKFYADFSSKEKAQKNTPLLIESTKEFVRTHRSAQHAIDMLRLGVAPRTAS